ncbi:MAG: hypothetical protein AAFX85_00450 [Pseudomonadota bacterium]
MATATTGSARRARGLRVRMLPFDFYRGIQALMSWRRITLVVALPVLVALLDACSGTASVVMADRIRAGNGYALIVVHTNWKPYEIGFERLQFAYAPRDQGRTGKVRVRRGGELELVELPAGDYQWQQVKLGLQVVPVSSASGFTVAEGTISYIGDVYAEYDLEGGRLVGLEVRDNSEEVRQRAREANAALLERYPLRVEEVMLLEADFEASSPR